MAATELMVMEARHYKQAMVTVCTYMQIVLVQDRVAVDNVVLVMMNGWNHCVPWVKRSTGLLVMKDELYRLYLDLLI